MIIKFKPRADFDKEYHEILIYFTDLRAFITNRSDDFAIYPLIRFVTMVILVSLFAGCYQYDET